MSKTQLLAYGGTIDLANEYRLLPEFACMMRVFIFFITWPRMASARVARALAMRGKS